MSMVPYSHWKLKNPLWIHTPDDGRGQCTVFLDGVELRNVVYADERFGEVEYCVMPLRISGGGNVETVRKTGCVVVVFPKP